MRVISKNPKFPEFWAEHPDAEAPLLAWHREAEHSDWRNFADVRQSYNHADQVGKWTIFNIGGNKYRLIVNIRFDWGKIFIHRVLTHEEYDQGLWKNG
jgi:mRNA interferase HigB